MGKIKEDNNIKTYVILSDAHLEVGDEVHPSYKLVKRFIRDRQPEQVILNGDILDFSYMSSFNKELDQLREGRRLSDDVKMMKKELQFFEENSFKKPIYLEGNHEYRLTKTVEKTPNFTAGVLSLPLLLDIDYFIPELNQPIELLDDLWIMHGKRATKHTASITLGDYMENIIFGHTHRQQTHTLRTWKKQVTAWNTGCLCSKSPGYGNGRQNNWVNGFAIVEEDSKGWQVTNILINDNTFIWNGKRYK